MHSHSNLTALSTVTASADAKLMLIAGFPAAFCSRGWPPRPKTQTTTYSFKEQTLIFMS